MSARAVLGGLALIAALSGQAARGDDRGAPAPSEERQPLLRERRRLLQADAAVVERLLARHRRGEDLRGAILAAPRPTVRTRRPTRAEVEAAQRALLQTRALLLKRKAALRAKTRARAAAARVEATARRLRREKTPPTPTTTSSPLEAGRYLFRAEAYREALAAWKRLPAEELEKSAARLLRFGSAAEYAGETALARATYQKLRQLFPRSRQATDAGFRLRFLDWNADLHAPVAETGGTPR